MGIIEYHIINPLLYPYHTEQSINYDTNTITSNITFESRL